MNDTFDSGDFCRLATSIFAQSRGKSFAQLEQEIEALCQKYHYVQEVAARLFIKRNLDRWLLLCAISTSQPSDLVDRLYQINVSQGFNDLHTQVFSAIEYAEYSRENGSVASGLNALQDVLQSLLSEHAVIGSPRHNFIRETEKWIRILVTAQESA